MFCQRNWAGFLFLWSNGHPILCFFLFFSSSGPFLLATCFYSQDYRVWRPKYQWAWHSTSTTLICLVNCFFFSFHNCLSILSGTSTSLFQNNFTPFPLFVAYSSSFKSDCAHCSSYHTFKVELINLNTSDLQFTRFVYFSCWSGDC